MFVPDGLSVVDRGRGLIEGGAQTGAHWGQLWPVHRAHSFVRVRFFYMSP